MGVSGTAVPAGGGPVGGTVRHPPEELGDPDMLAHPCLPPPPADDCGGDEDGGGGGAADGATGSGGTLMLVSRDVHPPVLKAGAPVF